ncbi:MAG: sel1 repeat family protein, partial [Gammaproteobacteria bacterium]|nr:sel1 repeat family protein [Gammaproteobacteria bacterium]
MTGRKFLFVILTFVSQIPGSLADIVAADNARAAGDYETAISEYTSLAQAGNPVAQATLGYMLYVGEGVPQD